MNTKEIIAQEKFHEISDKLDLLKKEFSKFNSSEIDNINTKEADDFREKILELEKVTSTYFTQFCYSKPRQNK